MDGKKETLDALFQSILEFAREGFKDDIDRAYEYFWEEDYPEDFLAGTSLDLAFINFEDWLICDHKTAEGKTFIDLYIERSKSPLPDVTQKALQVMRGSVISIYEVQDSSPAPKLKDLIFGDEISPCPVSGLKAGDIFGARFFLLNGEKVMARCVYPFTQKAKGAIFAYIDKQFSRYKKHKKPEGTMRDFLKDEAYTVNTIWINSLFKLK